MMETLEIDDVTALARDCLARAGTPEDAAARVAAEVTAAEAAGDRAGGLDGLLRDLRLLRYGRLRGAARATVTHPAPGLVAVDGGHGFAAVALADALDALVAQAETQGVALLQARRVSDPGGGHAPLAGLAAAGLDAILCAGAARMTVAGPGRAPHLLPLPEAAPLQRLLGVAPADSPAPDNPVGDPVDHACWIIAASPARSALAELALDGHATAAASAPLRRVTVSADLLANLIAT